MRGRAKCVGESRQPTHAPAASSSCRLAACCQRMCKLPAPQLPWICHAFANPEQSTADTAQCTVCCDSIDSNAEAPTMHRAFLQMSCETCKAHDTTRKHLKRTTKRMNIHARFSFMRKAGIKPSGSPPCSSLLHSLSGTCSSLCEVVHPTHTSISASIHAV